MSSYESKKESKSKPDLYSLYFLVCVHTEENFFFNVSLLDYHGDLKHNGFIVRDKKKDETDKKRYIKRHEIDKKEYKNKHKFTPKKS